MDINIEKLIAKIRTTEATMQGDIRPDRCAKSLGYVDGVEWKLIATTVEGESETRLMHEDAFVPGRKDEYAGSNDFPKTAPDEGGDGEHERGYVEGYGSSLKTIQSMIDSGAPFDLIKATIKEELEASEEAE